MHEYRANRKVVHTKKNAVDNAVPGGTASQQQEPEQQKCVERRKNLECTPYPEAFQSNGSITSNVVEEKTRDQKATQDEEQINPDLRSQGYVGDSEMEAEYEEYRNPPQGIDRFITKLHDVAANANLAL
jgi:hypothetical protein